MVRKGWDIFMHYGPGCTIEMDLGEYPHFLSQCLRWARTTWRSNAASFFTDRTVWYRQPWCVYAVYLTSMVNFALLYDPAMIYTHWMSVRELEDGPAMILSLVTTIFVSKLVKTYPYWIRHPGDLWYLPLCIMFGYFHSLIKLYALVTFWVILWGSRAGVE